MVIVCLSVSCFCERGAVAAEFDKCRRKLLCAVLSVS